MISSKKSCPIPFDQQPLNEYISLKQSWLFAWSLSSRTLFVSVLCFLFLFIVPSTSILFFLLKISQHFYVILLFNFFISNMFLFFALIRIYLGWSYVLKRLLSAIVFYEESGWYDGQIWIKTSDYLMQDRLIGLYEIMPFIVRIKYTFLFVLLNFIFISILKFLLYNG
uniref:Ycf36 n=1 Tax=Polysiphonia sertularioides TaxID=945028 RepID=A0A1Z1M8T5_9FLOR|nr:hypothetical protein [Polysiphonia sertularioides]ARW62507.1 hypothetical protein [Polysiphonia sertularioides]